MLEPRARLGLSALRSAAARTKPVDRRPAPHDRRVRRRCPRRPAREPCRDNRRPGCAAAPLARAGAALRRRRPRSRRAALRARAGRPARRGYRLPAAHPDAPVAPRNRCDRQPSRRRETALWWTWTATARVRSTVDRARAAKRPDRSSLEFFHERMEPVEDPAVYADLHHVTSSIRIVTTKCGQLKMAKWS